MPVKCEIFLDQESRPAHTLDFLAVPRVGEIITVKNDKKPAETMDFIVKEVLHTFADAFPRINVKLQKHER